MVLYQQNLEIIQLNNIMQAKIFIIIKIKLVIINNYIMCDIDNDKYDEILYNFYHKEYIKYYDTKIIVWTNNANWCKNNFNVCYYNLV